MQREALTRILQVLERPENTLPGLSKLDDAELVRLREAIEHSCTRHEQELATAFGRALPAVLRERLWRIRK